MARALGQLIAIGSILVVLVLSGRWLLHRSTDSSAQAQPTEVATMTAVPTQSPAPPTPSPTPVDQISTVEVTSAIIYHAEKHSLPDGATADITQIGLNQGDYVIGHGKGFMSTIGGCQVFLISGPYNNEIRITSGEWTEYIDQKIPPETAEMLFQREIVSVRETPGCAEPSVSRLP